MAQRDPCLCLFSCRLILRASVASLKHTVKETKIAGQAKPWQEAVKLVGANSGKAFAWGVDGENAKVFSADAVGARPPGALKFAMPENAIDFEVDLTLDTNRTKLASILALVLMEKPNAPYHYTVAQVRRNVTPEVLAELRLLEDGLFAQSPSRTQAQATTARWRDGAFGLVAP